jgi:hypothetical protein
MDQAFLIKSLNQKAKALTSSSAVKTAVKP